MILPLQNSPVNGTIFGSSKISRSCSKLRDLSLMSLGPHGTEQLRETFSERRSNRSGFFSPSDLETDP